MRKTTRGSGGDEPPPPRAPIEDNDSLHSKQYARVVDLLSEGEIEGFATPDNIAQSIFFDDTPLANSDGSYNFQGVTVAAVYGTQAQAYLPGFSVAEAEVAVATEVKYNTGGLSATVTRSITNANVDKVRVTIGTPRITEQNTTNGDLSGAFFRINIELQSNGGGFVKVVDDLFYGKTTTRYRRNYEIALTGSGPWDVRVRRVTPDSTSSNLSNSSWWDSYTEIIDSKFSYPNSAVVGIELDASQFSNVPRRGFEILGIKVQIPSNYNPHTREYTGVWDGTFVTAWTDSPAWCFYDIVTNARYGLGAYVSASQVDKWTLYSIGQYCDELVDDGFGGLEPRFTCSLYLQTRAEAFKVIMNFASIFRGMAYWSAGAIVPVADMPSDPVMIFNRSNVIDGKFSYQGSSRNARHTVALIAWNDPEDAFRQKIEYVEDLAGIARYGVVETEIVSFGCISRGQAHRNGRWLLYSERLETETVTFKAGLDGYFCSPGSIIQTQDSSRSGKRFGGRIMNSLVSAITIDQAVTLETGKTYTLSVMNSTGVVVSAVLSNAPGTTSVLTPIAPFSEAPQLNSVWGLAANDLAMETWRIVGVSESDKNILSITALEHDTTKFDAVEQNLILEPAATSSLNSRPNGVTNLTGTENLFLAGPGSVSNRFTLSWTGSTGRYKVNYRGDASNWISLPETVSQTIDIDSLAPDFYTFTVVQMNALGIASPVNTLRIEILGKIAVPVAVEQFTVVASGGFALASWAQHADLDVRYGGGLIQIRHEAVTSGAVWNNGVILDEFDGNAVSGTVPLIAGTYMAKAIDSTFHYASSSANFYMTEGMVTGFTTVGTQTEAPTFTGTKVGCGVVSSKLTLIAGGALFDSVGGNFDSAAGNFDSYGGQSAAGTYTFGPLDLTTVATRRFEADIVMRAFDNNDFFDARSGMFDDADGVFDGSSISINDAVVILNARLTNDNPAGSPTWDAWRPFMVADFNCRAVQFRLDMSVDSPSHNIEISTLTIHSKVPA